MKNVELYLDFPMTLSFSSYNSNQYYNINGSLLSSFTLILRVNYNEILYLMKYYPVN